MSLCNLWWKTSNSWPLERGQICLHKRTFLGNKHKKNAKMRYPSALLAIDETLYPYRGCISFKQCNPNIPSKDGLFYEVFVMPLYCTPTSAYHGRQTRNPWVRCGEIICYGNWWIFKYLVNGLSAHCKMEEINISMDRCFTSVSLASWALEKSITIIGTMRHSRIGIPKELKSVANIEEKSVM